MADRDRVGIAWRRELAMSIRANLDRIDLVQVIADDWLRLEPAATAMLRALAREVPLHLHGIGLGLASAVPVESRRLDALARLVGAVEPDSWSEHLAFVRGGGIELGHLAAPPRTRATIDGACANLARAQTVVGSRPAIENVATVLVPPGSTLDEGTWTRAILDATGAPMLLDLHNLHTNAHNAGLDPIAFLDALPLARVTHVHVAGGRPEGTRIVDDHRHDVPPAVWVLLEEVASRVVQPLDVILEREGEYPPFGVLLAELDTARAALALGRARQRRRREAA